MSSSTSSGPSLSKGGRGKKKPRAPPTSGSSSILTGPEALAAYAAHRESIALSKASTPTARPRTPIFTRPAPPPLKRACSNTSSSLPTIPVGVMAGASPTTSYFQHLFVKVALEPGMGEFNPTAKHSSFVGCLSTYTTTTGKPLMDSLRTSLPCLRNWKHFTLPLSLRPLLVHQLPLLPKPLSLPHGRPLSNILLPPLCPFPFLPLKGCQCRGRPEGGH